LSSGCSYNGYFKGSS